MLLCTPIKTINSISKPFLLLALLPLFFTFIFYASRFFSWHFPIAHSQLATSSSFTLNSGDFTSNSWEDAHSQNYQLSGGLSGTNLNNDPYGAYSGINFFTGEVIDPLTYTAFTIDKTAVEFNSLSPKIFSERTSNLEVITNNPTGYSLSASQNSPLTITDGIQIISSTSCDYTATCSASTAQPWLLENSSGFGFNAHGEDASSDFISSDHYRPFADQSLGEKPALIAYRDQVLIPNQAFPTTITYRVNVSGDQQAGRYQNTIFYTALPNL